MLDTNLIISGILIPVSLSVVYSRNPKKNKLLYNLTRGVLYIINAAIVLFSAYFCRDSLQTAVTELAVAIAIFEGLPLILVPIFNGKDNC